MNRLLAAVGLSLSACAPKSPAVALERAKLPPIRVTTRSELVLQCVPSDAEVVLDGVPQGSCDDFRGEPKGLTLQKGVRRVQVRKAGYLPWDTILETDGTRVMMTVTLISSK
ncbi:MAG: hypothetical protein ACOZQL_30160 [Myxococcota bacterium]